MKKPIAILGMVALAASFLAIVPTASASHPNECGANNTNPDFNCLEYSRYCSPNNPPDDGGPNCERGIWIYYVSGFCTVWYNGACVIH
jgi:hypothetical protein